MVGFNRCERVSGQWFLGRSIGFDSNQYRQLALVEIFTFLKVNVLDSSQPVRREELMSQNDIGIQFFEKAPTNFKLFSFTNTSQS